MDSELPRSHSIENDEDDLAWISAHAASSSSDGRERRTTRTSSFANDRDIARPMPFDAPVTRNVFLPIYGLGQDI